MKREISGPARKELGAAAHCLSDEPFPADLLDDREEMVQAGLLRRRTHPLWGEALLFNRGIREAFPAAREPIQSFVRRAADAYVGYFVWPPTEMLQNARLWEPHLDGLLGAAKRLEQWKEAARVLHHRGLMVAWFSNKYERPLAFALEAVVCLRRGEPDAGLLALVLSGLASWQQALGRLAESKATIEESLRVLEPLVAGKKSIEIFLLQVHLGLVCEKLGDASGAQRARAAAAAQAAELSPPGLAKHVNGTLSWAQWSAQRYIGI